MYNLFLRGKNRRWNRFYHDIYNIVIWCRPASSCRSRMRRRRRDYGACANAASRAAFVTSRCRDWSPRRMTQSTSPGRHAARRRHRSSTRSFSTGRWRRGLAVSRQIISVCLYVWLCAQGRLRHRKLGANDFKKYMGWKVFPAFFVKFGSI